MIGPTRCLPIGRLHHPHGIAEAIAGDHGDHHRRSCRDDTSHNPCTSRNNVTPRQCALSP